jgi:hypothetical protein
MIGEEAKNYFGEVNSGQNLSSNAFLLLLLVWGKRDKGEGST